MLANIIKTALFLALVAAPVTTKATDIESILSSAEDKSAARHPSHMELMTPEEVNNFNTLIAGSSSSHLNRFKESIGTQFGVLLKSLTTGINARHEKLVKWAKFHASASGKLKGWGYVVTAVSAVGWGVSLTPIPCDVQNWLGIASTAGIATGAALIWLSRQSQLTVVRLDNELMSDMGRTLHLQSLIDKEERRRRAWNDQADSSEDEDDMIRASRRADIDIEPPEQSIPKAKKKKKKVRIHEDDPLEEDDRRLRGELTEIVVHNPINESKEKGKDEAQ